MQALENFARAYAYAAHGVDPSDLAQVADWHMAAVAALQQCPQAYAAALAAHLQNGQGARLECMAYALAYARNPAGAACYLPTGVMFGIKHMVQYVEGL